ncbi:succinate dehydrogenase assembly factor 2 [uncultured Thalassospira sp.]|jgi:antitoxin CptB|uniref:FAD assembly factor SdhE n=1 Tax=uncultured Thalassospira sp. TaxID=404382 RepID=UPI0030DB263C|tara:strand:- start:15619 stop:15894 length:276 start_codon:yes stop_codon:yes gene_type:complete
MTDHDNELELRRKKLQFRGAHRGTKENDILVGRFMDAHLAALTERQLDDFEALIVDVPEADFFKWATGKEKAPVAYDTDVLAMINELSNAR